MTEPVQFPRIESLSTTLANQIAAGEVVERPASVVKELLENALDAGATKIDIDLQRAGVVQIRVCDNGIGVHADDMSKTISSHATSKLKTVEQLHAINTFGFRGEALASIASVSRFSLTSRRPDAGQALKLSASPNTEMTIEPCAHNTGTTVEVNDLFFNVPARRKFLRSEQTEYLHILALIKAIALANFDCAFTARHNGRSVLNLPVASHDYASRVAAICGKSFIEHAIAFEFNHEDMAIWGWLGNKDAARNQSDRQYLYLNQRLIKDKRLNHAIRVAFQDQIYPGRFPAYVMFMNLPADTVDVNVHPGKQEVRFRRHRDLHDFIMTSLTKLLNRDQEHIADNSYPNTHVKVKPAQTIVAPLSINEGLKSYQAVTRQPEHSQQIKQSRFHLTTHEDNYLLFDLHAIRQEMVRQRLTALGMKESLIVKPMLFPQRFNLNEESLDNLEQIQETIRRMGIHFRRTAPDQVMITEVTEELFYIDAKKILAEIVMLENLNGDDTNLLETLGRIFSAHANDRLPEYISTTELDTVMKFYQNHHDNTDIKTRHLWRIIDEASVLKLFH